MEPNDLLTLTGPADRNLVDRLCALAEGRAGWAADLWDEWLTSEVVERDTDLGAWRFSHGQPDASITVANVARKRLAHVMRDDLAEISRAARILCCAALEGRYFTAEAVAAALGIPRDEILDLLDDRLAASDDRPDGLIEEVGAIALTDMQGRQVHVWRYRFVSQLFRTAFVRFGLSAAERAAQSAALASALEQIFGVDRARVATSLAALHGSAGNLEKANEYRRLAASQMPTEVILEQARAYLAAPDIENWGRAECLRASTILGDAANAFSALGELDHTVEAVQLRASVARRAGLVADEADALMMLGATEIYMGAPDTACAHLEEGAALWRSIERRDGEAESLKHLSWIHGLAGDRNRAMQEIQAALDLRRRMGNERGVLDLHMHTANLAIHWADLSLARKEMNATEPLLECATPREHAHIADMRGVVALQSGETQEALEHYQRAAKLFHDLGEVRHEAAVTRGIGIVLHELGRLPEARRVLSESIVTAQSMANVAGEAEARFGLAQVELESKNLQAGIREMAAAVRLFREAGSEHFAKGAQDELDAARRGTWPNA